MKKVVFSTLKMILITLCTYAFIKGYDNLDLIKSSFINGYNNCNF